MSCKLLDSLSCSISDDYQFPMNNIVDVDEMVQYRLTVSPTDAFDRDCYGRTSLYLALRYNPSPYTIRMLYEANKVALKTPDVCGITPMVLLYRNEYPIDILDALLDMCPEKFVTPTRAASGKTILKELEQAWTGRIKKENLTPRELRRDPSLLLQWEKFMHTLQKARSILIEDANSSTFTTRDEETPPFLSPQVNAAIDLSGPHQLSSELILFILKLYHQPNAKHSKSQRLINLLTRYKSREEVDDKGDTTLEAILLYRLLLCPSEALHSDVGGGTTFYQLLKHYPTVRSIKMLYNANPIALTTPDFCGISPIALAYLRCYSIHILKTLLELQPGAFLVGCQRSFLCQSVSDELNAYSCPSVFDELNTSWNRLITTKAVTMKMLRNEPDLLEQWDKFMATVQAASLFFADEEHNESFAVKHDAYSIPQVHAALQLKGPNKLSITVLAFTMNMYPKQLSTTMDVKGRRMLPLHYILEEFGASKAMSDSDIDITGFLHLLRTMLTLFPEGVSLAHPETRNSLPLHIALEKNINYDEGVSDLIGILPHSIHIVQEESGLAPFMIASEGKGSDLSTIYDILREAPSSCQKLID